MDWTQLQALTPAPGQSPDYEACLAAFPALELAKDKLTPAYVERPAIPGQPGERVVCMEYARDWLLSNRNTVERRQSRYGIDPVAAREALRIYCAHTINRPAVTFSRPGIDTRTIGRSRLSTRKAKLSKAEAAGRFRLPDRQAAE